VVELEHQWIGQSAVGASRRAQVRVEPFDVPAFVLCPVADRSGGDGSCSRRLRISRSPARSRAAESPAPPVPQWPRASRRDGRIREPGGCVHHSRRMLLFGDAPRHRRALVSDAPHAQSSPAECAVSPARGSTP
jgi:hypothetical protein